VLTLVERRAPWQPGPAAEWSAVDIAQQRYDERSRSWSRYWQRATGRWLRYDGISSSPDVDVLLAEIDADPSPACSEAESVRNRCCTSR
jgi:hypothetical protein